MLSAMRKALLILIVSGLAGVGFLAVVLWAQRPGNLPSSFFRLMDRNHDGVVAFDEWKAYHEKRLHWPGTEWDFHFQDCNGDQQLTWSEYRAWTFNRKACKDVKQLASRPVPPNSFSFCETDPATGMQTCVVGSSTGEQSLEPIVGPMQELEIPQ
jgi:hypothetical protein